jgi:hypothetical protein
MSVTILELARPFSNFCILKTASSRIQEGPFSNILQETWVSPDKSQKVYVVLKVAATRRKFSKEPHDIVKEMRIVRRLSHVNVSRLVFELLHSMRSNLGDRS